MFVSLLLCIIIPMLAVLLLCIIIIVMLVLLLLCIITIMLVLLLLCIITIIMLVVFSAMCLSVFLLLIYHTNIGHIKNDFNNEKSSHLNIIHGIIKSMKVIRLATCRYLYVLFSCSLSITCLLHANHTYE